MGRLLGCTRATAAAIVADLHDLGLVDERVAAPTGQRGRPTTQVVPSALGPAVVAMEIGVDAVSIASVTLGGFLHDVERTPFDDQDPGSVLTLARQIVHERLRVLGRRCAAVGIGVYGLVDRTTGIVVEAPNLGWSDVELVERLRLPADLPVSIDNIAMLAAHAEATRGRGSGQGTVLFVHAAVGLGGATLLNGTPLRGRSGLAGEYGHMPLGTAGLDCRCGRRGCWETEADQLALARAAGVPTTPATASTIATEILLAARAGDPESVQAVDQVARALGAGLGALVNAYDPHSIVLAGHAADILTAAPHAVETAATRTALSAHRRRFPPIAASKLDATASLRGAAESHFTVLLDDPTGLAQRSTHASSRP